MTEPVELLTFAEAAERLHVSQRTLFRKMRAGRIRPVRIGRRTLFTVREFNAYVASEASRVA